MKKKRDHPARVAYSEGADSIRLTHLVADYPGMVEAKSRVIKEAETRNLRKAWRRRSRRRNIHEKGSGWVNVTPTIYTKVSQV